MCQTLFYIPERIFGWSLFGAGVLLAVWAVASVILLAWLVRRQGFNADTWGYVPLLLLVGAVIWWVLPKISEPGLGLPIRGYGTMLLIAVVCGSALATWQGYRLGVDPDVTMTFIFWGFVPGILGGRLFYVIWKWHEFQRPGLMATLGEMINITQGGLVVYGALIGGLLGFTAFLIKQRLPILAMLDIVTPGMLLGLALGRVGCFLNGCCFGGACELPWAVRFPAGSPPFVHEVQEGKIPLYGLKLTGPSDEAPVISEVEAGSPADILGLKPGQTIAAINGVSVKTAHAAQWVLIDALRLGKGVAIKTIESKSPVQVPLPQPRPRTRPIHPTQLYSSLDALVLCLFLVAYGPFKRRDGELVALLLTLYPINRFLMEFIRTDEASVLGTPLKVPQVVSLLFLALVAGLWWYILRKPPGKAFPAEEG